MRTLKLPTADGTLVRETWDVSKDRQRPMLKIGSMPRQAEDGMRATLARIAALLGRTPTH